MVMPGIGVGAVDNDTCDDGSGQDNDDDGDDGDGGHVDDTSGFEFVFASVSQHLHK